MKSALAAIERNWPALSVEFQKPYMHALRQFLIEERAQGAPSIYPPMHQIFNALTITPFLEVKVVIVGQDPYHGPGQAHGLAFSVPPGVAIPPSLHNIFKELKSDLAMEPPTHGCLIPWGHQGVLLLNATLTVRASMPQSHAGRGWELFTDRILALLWAREDPIVFLLWGKAAQEKCARLPVYHAPHLLLKAAHPSPFSAYRGFLGCRHFSKANAFLSQHKKPPIDWTLQSDPVSCYSH